MEGDDVDETRKMVDQRLSRQSWRRLAQRGLCCARCGGSEGVWVPKVICRACQRPKRQDTSTSEGLR